MKLKLEYSAKQKNNPVQLSKLLKYIERQQIEGVKKVELKQRKAKLGEMGEGLASSLAVVLNSATNPLTKLMEAIVEWVKLMKSEIHLVGQSGKEMTISAKLKPNEINQMIDKFLNNDYGSAKYNDCKHNKHNQKVENKNNDEENNN